MQQIVPTIPKHSGRLADVAVDALNLIKDTEQSGGCGSEIIVLVDGLGWSNLTARAGHAPFLRGLLPEARPALAGFPTTTVTQLSSLTTGTLGGEHGMVGYSVFDRSTGKTRNLISGWVCAEEAMAWQSASTVFEMATAQGIPAFAVLQQKYLGSAFSAAVLRGATQIGADSIADRFLTASGLATENPGSLIYLYVPEWDGNAHQYGWQSDRWGTRLEELDAQLAYLNVQANKHHFRVTLTADHGMVDVNPSQFCLIDDLDIDLGQIIGISGEPRCLQISLARPESTDEFAARLTTAASAWVDEQLVLTREQVIDGNWYGDTLTKAAFSRLGDIFVIQTGLKSACYDRRTASSSSMNMIGQHGGMNQAEQLVPLIRFGA